jgi:hypothetical protein
MLEEHLRRDEGDEAGHCNPHARNGAGWSQGEQGRDEQERGP